MIIELPMESGRLGLPMESGRLGRRYRAVLFHFSNNNLAIRMRCADELGRYDPITTTSEDVDICFRLIKHPGWVACREPGAIIRHKARRTVPAMLHQMWGWGIHLGRAYLKTELRGTHVYWVSRKGPAITRGIEIPWLPGFVCVFATDFHLMHLLAATAIGLAIAGLTPWAIGVGVLAACAALSYLAVVWSQPLSVWARFKLALAHYASNVVFITASFIGGLRCGIVLVPASMFPPREASRR